MVVRKYTLHCGLWYSCVCRIPYKTEDLQTFPFIPICFIGLKRKCTSLFLLASSLLVSLRLILVIKVPDSGTSSSSTLLSMWFLSFSSSCITGWFKLYHYYFTGKKNTQFPFFPTMHPSPELLLVLQYLEKCVFVSRTFRFSLAYQQFSNLQSDTLQYLWRERSVLKFVFSMQYLLITWWSLLLSQSCHENPVFFLTSKISDMLFALIHNISIFDHV